MTLEKLVTELFIQSYLSYSYLHLIYIPVSFATMDTDISITITIVTIVNSTDMTTNKLLDIVRCEAEVGRPKDIENIAIPGSEQSMLFLLQSNQIDSP
jgi:hypothetical protein